MYWSILDKSGSSLFDKTSWAIEDCYVESGRRLSPGPSSLLPESCPHINRPDNSVQNKSIILTIRVKANHVSKHVAFKAPLMRLEASNNSYHPIVRLKVSQNCCFIFRRSIKKMLWKKVKVLFITGINNKWKTVTILSPAWAHLLVNNSAVC